MRMEGDTGRVINIRLLAHEEWVSAEELWDKRGDQVAMVAPQLLQTSVGEMCVCVYMCGPGQGVLMVGL